MNLPTQAALARYGAVKVTTANPGQILVMLYDGLMRFLREAQGAFVAKERARAGERISRSLAILDQLLVGLDPKHAPDLCEKLQSVYIFCIQRLVSASVGQDADMVGEVIRVLAPLRDAWSTAVLEVASAPR
jgi:flagellar protein FliS